MTQVESEAGQRKSKNGTRESSRKYGTLQTWHIHHQQQVQKERRSGTWYSALRQSKLSFFSSFSFASSETRPPRGPESMNEVDTGKVTSVSLQGGADVVPWRKEIEAAIPSISISRQLKMDVPFAITCRRILLTTVTSSTISRKKF
jgi:hypothetical protein